jgi:hypothetical protein
MFNDKCLAAIFLHSSYQRLTFITTHFKSIARRSIREGLDDNYGLNKEQYTTNPTSCKKEHKSIKDQFVDSNNNESDIISTTTTVQNNELKRCLKVTEFIIRLYQSESSANFRIQV